MSVSEKNVLAHSASGLYQYFQKMLTQTDALRKSGGRMCAFSGLSQSRVCAEQDIGLHGQTEDFHEG